MKNKKVFLISLIAIMAGMGIALDRLGSIQFTDSIKITCYPLPIMVVGIVQGPLAGTLTGLIVGMVSQLLYGLSPSSVFWALAPISWGLISGVIAKISRNKNKLLSYSLSVVLASICANLLNTFAMYMDALLIRDSWYTTVTVIANWPGRIVLMLIAMIPYILILRVVCERLKSFPEYFNEKDNTYLEHNHNQS